MKIVNTDQAEQWNTGDDAAHWVTHQDRYDRMKAPFADMILDAACAPAPTSSTWAAAAAPPRWRPRGSSHRVRRSALTCPAPCWPGPGPPLKRPASATRPVRSHHCAPRSPRTPTTQESS